MENEEKLRTLESLKDNGLITKAQFEERKALLEVELKEGNDVTSGAQSNTVSVEGRDTTSGSSTAEPAPQPQPQEDTTDEVQPETKDTTSTATNQSLAGSSGVPKGLSVKVIAGLVGLGVVGVVSFMLTTSDEQSAETPAPSALGAEDKGGAQDDDQAPTPSKVATEPIGIAGVPDLDLSIVDNAAAKNARSRNSKALKHHKKADWDLAIDSYIDGLQSDPGHILMRYNLGCAYAMNGQHEKALTILRQFKDAERCGLCEARLIRAKSDSDWTSLWADERFQALTENAVPIEHDYKKLTKRLLKNMGKAYWALMKRTVDAGYAFRVNVTYPPKHKGMVIQDGSALARWKVDLGGRDATMSPGELPSSKIKCRGSCCTVKGKNSGVEMAVARIENVCFWPVDDENVFLHAIKLRYLEP